MSIAKYWSMSGLLFPKPKLILTELQGLTLSTLSLKYYVSMIIITYVYIDYINNSI